MERLACIMRSGMHRRKRDWASYVVIGWLNHSSGFSGLCGLPNYGSGRAVRWLGYFRRNGQSRIGWCWRSSWDIPGLGDLNFFANFGGLVAIFDSRRKQFRASKFFVIRASRHNSILWHPPNSRRAIAREPSSIVNRPRLPGSDAQEPGIA